MSPSPAVGEDLREADEVDQLAAAVMSFVRNFGLLQPDRTPCGKPLSVSQAHALAEIEARPGITQRELTDSLGLARATMSELVAQLIDRGWVTQATSPVDRRQRCLSITDAGRRVVADIAEARRHLISEIIAPLGADQRTLVINATQLLAEGARQRRDGHPVEVRASGAAM